MILLNYRGPKFTNVEIAESKLTLNITPYIRLLDKLFTVDKIYLINSAQQDILYQLVGPNGLLEPEIFF